MKNYIIIPIFILIFACATHNAFAENLVINTDSNSYEYGEIVKISGDTSAETVALQIICLLYTSDAADE